MSGGAKAWFREVGRARGEIGRAGGPSTGGFGGASGHAGGAGQPPAPAALPFARRAAMFRAMGATISIMVNGEARQVAVAASLADLLAQLGLDTRKVAVERNLEIVPLSSYAATALAAGDQLEIVHFIGGG